MIFSNFPLTKKLTVLGVLLLSPVALSAATLTNGSGDGDVTIQVDGYGASTDAFFDPAGPITGVMFSFHPRFC